ncbi:hypothetical protein EC973_008941, partial [Apophysomyces ossiformis]
VLQAVDADLDRDWEKWLALAIHHDHDAWFENRLAKRNLTWSEARKIFIQRFESPDRMIAMASKAYSMVMDRQELVLDYSTRFQKAYHEGGIVDNEGLALRFLVSLLPHIRENVQVAWHGRHGKKLPQSVEEVLEVALAVSVQKRAHHQFMDDSASRPTSKRRLNAWSGSSVSKGHKHTTVGCAYHGPKAHHSTEECKKKVPSTTANKQENNCTYCGRPYTPGHRCQEYRDAKAKKAQQMTNPLRLNAVSRSTPPVTPATTNHPADEVVDNLTHSMDDLEFEST